MYQKHSKTSKEAYDELDSSGQKDLILWEITASQGTGRTACELERIIGANMSTVAARITELRSDGRIITTKKVRKTTRGRDANVHVARHHYEDEFGVAPIKRRGKSHEDAVTALLMHIEMSDYTYDGFPLKESSCFNKLLNSMEDVLCG